MALALPRDDLGRRFRVSGRGTFETQCARCGQVDDHPKHGVGVIAGTAEPASIHTDCHALMGCPVCIHQREVHANVTTETGDALREVLTAAGPLDDDLVADLLGQTPGKEG
jgi:hypothetical protein